MAQKMTSGRIPVVDFRAFSIAHEEIPPVKDTAVQELVKQLYSACSTMGFVYLTNHGVSQDEIDNVLHMMATFFTLKTEVKTKYRKTSAVSETGWSELERQHNRFNSAAGDLIETFDITGEGSKDFKFEDDDLIPNFMSTLKSFYQRLQDLGLRVLMALAIGLQEDPDVFLSTHKSVFTEDGFSTLRFNYYPGITNDTDVKPGQIRCGEHSDFGSITLLLQDDAGGLEIQTQDGKFIPVTPIPGTVLVNIADVMQRWTSDRLKSVVHRVVIPEEQCKKERVRQSIAFFMGADSETLISCLDGSDKYPPVKAGEYLKDKLRSLYIY